VGVGVSPDVRKYFDAMVAMFFAIIEPAEAIK